MPNTSVPNAQAGPLRVYEIRIEGHLGDGWRDWFEGLMVTLEEDGTTRLTGPVIDQSALFGLLKKVRDLGLPLVSINRMESSKIKKGEKDEYKPEDH